MKNYMAYKFRLYPNKEQRLKFNQTFGCSRFLYNQMLAERIGVYEKLKDNREELYAYKYKTEKEYKDEFDFLKDVDSIALQQSRIDLNRAYLNFFRGLKKGQDVGFPKFKCKHGKQRYRSICVNGNINVDFEDRFIKIPKIGWVKYRDDRVFDSEKIKSITVSKNKIFQYFVSILVEEDIDIKVKNNITEDRVVAFDMSSSQFAVSSDLQVENPRIFSKEERRMRIRSRRLSRKKKLSSNWKKVKLRLARFHNKLSNRRNDWVHKFSTELSRLFDAIAVEDLNIKGIQKFNSRVSRNISLDFSWSMFVKILEYKMEKSGGQLIKISRWFPSSKTCSKCGLINKDLKLSERVWTCECGAVHDREINASINIKNEALRILKELNLLKKPTGAIPGSYAC